MRTHIFRLKNEACNLVSKITSQMQDMYLLNPNFNEWHMTPFLPCLCRMTWEVLSTSCTTSGLFSCAWSSSEAEARRRGGPRQWGGSGIWSYTFLRAGAILLVRVPATMMQSACLGLARNTTPKRSMSYRGAAKCIISTAQQARPKVRGQMELLRAQLSRSSTLAKA